MIEPHRTLSARQREAVRWLRAKINGKIDRNYLRDAAGLSGAECQRLLAVLESEQCIRVLPSDQTCLQNGFVVEATIEQFVERMDAPPPRNLWNEMQARCFGKWWFVALVALSVVLGTLVAAMTNIQFPAKTVHWILMR